MSESKELVAATNERPRHMLERLNNLDLAEVGDTREIALPPDIEQMLSQLPTRDQLRKRTAGAGNVGGWDRTTVRRLVLAMLVGAPHRLAADFAGMSRRSIYDWRAVADDAMDVIRESSESHDSVREYAEAGVISRNDAERVLATRLINRATAYTKLDAVQSWRRGFDDDWRAAAEYLARVDPDEFGRKDQMEVRHQHAVVLLPPVGNVEQFMRGSGAERGDAARLPQLKEIGLAEVEDD